MVEDASSLWRALSQQLRSDQLLGLSDVPIKRRERRPPSESFAPAGARSSTQEGGKAERLRVLNEKYV